MPRKFGHRVYEDTVGFVDLYALWQTLKLLVTRKGYLGAHLVKGQEASLFIVTLTIILAHKLCRSVLHVLLGLFFVFAVQVGVNFILNSPCSLVL